MCATTGRGNILVDRSLSRPEVVLQTIKRERHGGSWAALARGRARLQGESYGDVVTGVGRCDRYILLPWFPQAFTRSVCVPLESVTFVLIDCAPLNKWSVCESTDHAMLLVGWVLQLLEFACSRNGEFTTEPLDGTTTFTSAANDQVAEQSKKNARAAGSRTAAENERELSPFITPPEAHWPGRLEGNVPPARSHVPVGFVCIRMNTQGVKLPLTTSLNTPNSTDKRQPRERRSPLVLQTFLSPICMFLRVLW
jgi:hypothetical protein